MKWIQLLVGISLIPLIIQDIRCHRISGRILMKAILTSLMLQLILLPVAIKAGLLEQTIPEYYRNLLARLLLNVALSAGLIGVSHFTGESIGKGDTVTMLYIGTVLSFQRFIIFLMLVFLLAGLCALVLMVIGWISHRRIREFALLPVLGISYGITCLL